MSKQDNLLKAILENNPGKARKALQPGFMGMIKAAKVNAPLVGEHEDWTALMAATEKGQNKNIRVVM